MLADFALPILVVRHIALGFTKGLATWLDSVRPWEVKVMSVIFQTPLDGLPPKQVGGWSGGMK